MKRRRCLGLLAAAAAAAPAGRSAAAPLTVHDALGRAVTFAEPPQRIVTIFASNTEIVAALGLADRIVGIEAYTRYPPEVLDRPLVGGRLGFSVDAVARQQPDLVVVTPARQAANQLVAPMERLGIPIVVLLHRSLAEIMANIRLIGRIAGLAERGETVAAGLEARLAQVQDNMAPRALPATIMITGKVGNGLLLVARPGTYTGDAVARAGGRFGFASRAVVAQVSPEAILEADPDVLLFAGSAADLAELVRRPGWADMRAVRTRRSHTVARAEFLIPGPRTVDGIERLAGILHPAAVSR